METQNTVSRMRELITQLLKANEAYYRDDDPIMTDREYDLLMEELETLEKKTGVVFANSPSNSVGGGNRSGLKKVKHTKPMLSAKKTKSVDGFHAFAEKGDTVLSWKMDGLTLVLRYEKGKLVRAITRGEDGTVGEDVTHNVIHMRNVPRNVVCRENLEVRGEGIVSWADYEILNRGKENVHPRNIAANTVRARVPEKGKLAHLDFFAFSLISQHIGFEKKSHELEYLAKQGFQVVEHVSVREGSARDAFMKVVESFDPKKYLYPVDGIMGEYDDLAFGRSLGATAHHENRMLALKWEDDLHETVFRGVELATTRSGLVSLIAKFDPVTIDGSTVRNADLHSLSNYEQFRFGLGDRITVYKANMIIPQVAENLTKSGTYRLPERCNCCGSVLEIRAASRKVVNLYCPNEMCIARNAQKIARFCDADAMNLEGFTATVLEKLMAHGFIREYADLYRLETHRDRIIVTPGFGMKTYERMIETVNKRRTCALCQLLNAVGIPLMNHEAALEIDDYFKGSWDGFVQALREGFPFSHIAGVTETLEKNIYTWYGDENEQELVRAVLEEVTVWGQKDRTGEAGNPFRNAVVSVTGRVNGMNKKDMSDLLSILGAKVEEKVGAGTTYLIVGQEPDTVKLASALQAGVSLITEGHFSRLLAETQFPQ